MIYIDTRAYMFETFVEMICFYCLFINMIPCKARLKKWLMGLIGLPVFFVLFVFIDMWSVLVFAGGLYLVFKIKWIDIHTINAILLAGIIILTVESINSVFIIHLFKFADEGWGIVGLSCLFTVTLTTFATIFAKRMISEKINGKINELLLFIIQLIVLSIIYFYMMRAHQLRIFDRSTSILLIFLALELLLMAAVFIVSNAKIQQHYDEKLEKIKPRIVKSSATPSQQTKHGD